MKNSISILLVSILLSLPYRAGAQWVQTGGPPGGYVLSFALSGTNIFAGTMGGGVFRSDDNGMTWKAHSSGLSSNCSVSCLAVSETKVFAGTFDDGVFVSADNGASWTAANSGLTGHDVYALAVSGKNVFAGLWHEGIFLSTDDGTSWTAVNSGLASKRWAGITVYCLLAAGTNVYAGTNSGLFRSVDHGRSWTAASSGMRLGTSVHQLVVSGPNLIALNYGYGARVYLSKDYGANWTEITSRFPAHTDVGYFAVRGTDLLAGTSKGRIFLSPDNGESWKPFKSTVPKGSSVNRLVTIGANLFVGTAYDGVLRSTDNGVSWRTANQGLSGTEVRALAARGVNLFTQGNLSVDGGANWMIIGSKMPGATYFNCLEEMGKDFFAGTDKGVFLSRDQGTTWHAADPKLSRTFVYDLVVKGKDLFAGTQSGVLISTNGGADWKVAGSGLPAKTPVRKLAATENDIFAVVGNESYFLFASRDNGASWTEIKLGPSDIQALAFVVSGRKLYVATQGGSDDFFVREEDGIKTIQGVCHVVCSADGGASWIKADSGLPGEFGVTCFEAWESNVFAGTWGAGVFFSQDGGASWAAFNSGLMNTRIHDLAVCAEYLYAGTQNGGVWRLRLPEIRSPGVNPYPALTCLTETFSLPRCPALAFRPARCP